MYTYPHTCMCVHTCTSCIHFFLVNFPHEQNLAQLLLTLGPKQTGTQAFRAYGQCAFSSGDTTGAPRDSHSPHSR